MKLIVLLVFLCLCLRVKISAAQCAAATILPSDVAPSIADEYFTSQLTKQIADLQQSVTKIVQAYHVDVYSVAVVYRDSTIFSAGLVDTPFRIGSVTKVFAAVGALLLRKQGMNLSLDDPVTKFLPRFSVINPDGEHDITLRELMGHTAGLPRNLCAGVFCYLGLSEEDILELIAKMQLARPPWSFLPVYSNLGFAILGHAWEKATSPRKTWSEFLRDELWAPLGMRDTGVPADLVDDVELAPGNVSPYLANYSIGWQAPAGDMYSTAKDLAKFLKFLLHPNPTGLLSDAAIREMTHPTTVFTSTSGLTGFALPWELIGIPLRGTNRSTTLITKNGGLGTYRSIIAFHPDSQLGVVVLTSVNDSSGTPSELLAIKAMQDLIPAVQSVHSSFISSLYSGVYICTPTDPVVSAHIENTTLQVLGGSLNVTTMTPDQNLVAVHNVRLVQNGFNGSARGSRALMRKPGRDRHSFWSAPGPCFAMASLLGAEAEIARPNFPESVALYELHFEPEAKLVRWPAVGGLCYKS